jgi:lipid-A-disaccharide synthase
MFPLCGLPVMWFRQVFEHAATFTRLISQADRFFRKSKPDAVVLIDYPGLHWWLARRARSHGIPVFWFVPPQLWAWAGWRVRKMRHFVDHVLTTLPFEDEWHRQRGVNTHYVGHPYFDELARQPLDRQFLDQQRTRQGTVVAILPGSRMQELENNLSSQLRAAQLLHQRLPNLRFLVAAYNAPQRQFVERALRDLRLPAEVFHGRTPEIIQLAKACIAVSGSVSLELLHGLVPTVVVYRVHWHQMLLSNLLKTTRWISLVNLLADEELFPEFLTMQCPAEAIANKLETWLTDEPARLSLQESLRRLRERVAEPGACERAAEYILERLERGKRFYTHPARRAACSISTS